LYLSIPWQLALLTFILINTFLYLDGNTPIDSQLFVIWGGANDFIHPTTLPDPAKVVANIVDHISTIAGEAQGAELKFLVPNLPPWG
jgi:hypothetical protein